MNLKHVFKSECPNVEELFNECSSLDVYFANLKKQEVNVKTANYLKHGFEALVEAIIHCEKGAMRIKNYSPVPSCNKDLCVSGTGEKSSGKKVSVMVCLVDDIDIPLTSNANHLTTFTSNSVEHYGVSVNEAKGFRIFTNAKSLHPATLEQFFNDKSVVFYLRSDIEKIVTGNEKFWITFDKAMGERSEKVVAKDGGMKLRPFQEEGSQKILNSAIGQVILPTGTGKTVIAMNAIYKEVEKINQINKSPCILIMTPRIVLTYQLLGDVIKYFGSNKKDAQYINVNSGDFNDDREKKAMAEMGLPVRDIPSTTTIREMEFYYDKAVKDGVPFIIAATYQSAPIISRTKIPIHMAIHDEAHNLVVGRFSTRAKQKVLKIKATKKVFLTATPAYAKDIKEELPEDPEKTYNGLGMENEQNYGKEIYHQSPKDMIEAGEIVPPYIHIVNVKELEMKGKVIEVSPDNLMDEDIEKNVELMAIVVERSFDEHLKQIKKYSCSPEKIGAKMLVVCSGDNTFRGFLNSKGFEAMKLNRNDIRFFGISSNFGAWIDGEHVEPQGGWYKEQFMLALRNLKQEENAIIFHIDMLAEGIDIPGITGVLPFRELGTIKSCQTLGRAMRIVPEDRKSLYDPISPRDPGDREHMIKPYAWAIIPVYSINHVDIKQRLENIVKRIRNDYKYKPCENFIIHTPPVGEYPPGETKIINSNQPDRVDLDQIIEDVMIGNEAIERQEEIIKGWRAEVNSEPVKETSVERLNIEVPAENSNNEDIFTMVYNGITARGKMSGDKFVVLSGSEVRERMNNSFINYASLSGYRKIREDMLNQKKIVGWKLVEDMEFESLSAAASVLVGSAMNGRTAWKLNDKTVQELSK